MAMTMDLDSVIKVLNRGIEVELKDRIRTKLMESMTAIVDEVATEYAEGLRMVIMSQRDYIDGGVDIHVQINDGLKREVK